MAIDYNGKRPEGSTLKLRFTLQCQPPDDTRFRFTALDVDITFPHEEGPPTSLQAVSIVKPAVSNSYFSGREKSSDEDDGWNDSLKTVIRNSRVAACSIREDTAQKSGLRSDYDIVVSVLHQECQERKNVRIHVRALTSDDRLWEIGGGIREASLLVGFE